MWELLKQTGTRVVSALALTLVVIGCMTTGAWAQSQASTGNISGRVVDSTGSAIAGATVKVKNTQTGLEQSVTTNEDGLYRLVLLPTGTYTVTAEASGFSSITAEGVVVVVGRQADVPLTLGAQGASEVITVSAGAIQVQTSRSEADAVQNEIAIQNLPILGRRFQDFVTLTPTAQVDAQRGQISLAGQRGINANIAIDGADNNNPFFGGLRGGERSNSAFTIPQESIKEFQVVAAGYSAEFGRSTGGLVNAVTKSGTNEYHGTAFYLLRHKELARSNEFFDTIKAGNPTTPRDDIAFDSVPTLQQWGGSFGGPIIENKAFFFGSYEQQRLRQPRRVLFPLLQSFVPNASTQAGFNFFKSQEGGFQQTNDAIAFLGRVDYEINASHRFNVRYNYSNNDAQNAIATGEALLPNTNRALTSNGTEGDRINTVAGQLTSFLNPTLVNEMRAQYSRERRPRIGNAEIPSVDNAIGSFGTRSFVPTTQFDWRFQVADSLTWSKGNHTIKFGGEYNHTFVDQDFGFNRFGVFGSRTSDPALLLQSISGGTPSGNRFDTANDQYRIQIGNGLVNFSTNEVAFFGQDSWKIRPNFTLNYGLRWEGQFNPTPFADNTALVNKVKDFKFPLGNFDPTQIPDATNQWAPRLGFAWDPFNDGKSVLRAFSGIYYARTPALILAGPMNNFRAVPGDVSLLFPLFAAGNPNNTVYKQFKLIGIDLNNFPLDGLPRLSPEQATQIATALGLAVDPTRGASVTGVASNFKNPRAYQAGVGFEREVAQGFTLGVDFQYVHTVYLERNVDLNVPAPIIRPSSVDPAGRPFYDLRNRPRPIPTLNQVQIRDSSARSLYRALTFSSKLQRKWGQVNLFYTLSYNYSNDDNERSAGGTTYDDSFNLQPEYNFSELDRRHQLVANPVFFLPFGFDVASAIRLQSGTPFDATAGTDLNGDLVNTDRPYSGPNQPFQRNQFRNLRRYNVDLRVQKHINFLENQKLTFSVEFFNLFNAMNLQYAGQQRQFCGGTIGSDCGFRGPTNLNFMQLREQNPTSTSLGRLLTGNTVGTPFQMQLGIRYQF